ncbi:11091_t:CDS:2 [Funneliformis geosporum]|uniref:8425_t:CDS:1 n=1 Tax=Funneliformis geosporum TaxID=1117311 RepID=A0A9W4SIW6_9GLOM|nr:8425_t:CDS:2 [Funneliformis geosporum]CAI2180028.1 11091_t:CDS:2 [Funneliformis geosporum]
MKNILNPNEGTVSLLNNDDITRTNRYGTFDEQSSIISELQKNSQQNILSASHNKLECGQSCFINPIAGCAKLCGSIPSPTTLVVKNNGSTARDNFSIERTFLSWLRISTGLVLLGMSFFLRFDTFSQPSVNEDHYSKPLGIFLIGLGFIVLIWALCNYFQFQQLYASRHAFVDNGALSFLVASLVGATIFLLLAINILQDGEQEDKMGDGTKISTISFI